MNFFAELKRRNVIRMAGLYLVGAWLVAQVAETILPAFAVPNWVMRAIVIVLALGFLPVMAFTWVFELTPAGFRRDEDVRPEESIAPQTAQRMNRLIFAVLALGLIYFGFDKFVLAPDRDLALVATTKAEVKASTTAAEEITSRHSVAVLPFVNMSGDPANEYFSDGISEEILNVLAGVPELQVAARTSSFSFKGKQMEVPAIARELKVRMVLEGSVRKQGDKVRITAQLIDARTGFHLWSQTYDRKLEDIFAIQDEIAKAIGDELKVKVGGDAAPGETARGTKNIAAYDLYLRGIALWNTRKPGDLLQAIALFQQATAEDRGFAQGYGGLALVYSVLPYYSERMPWAEAFALTNDFALRALALDPSLPEAYAALSHTSSVDFRRETGIELARRAVELRPSFATGHQWLGNSLLSSGDPQSALASNARASVLDPRSPVIADNHAFVLLALGRTQEARDRCLRLLETTPTSQGCLQYAGFADLVLGDYEAARPLLMHLAEVQNPSARDQASALIDALQGRADRHALAEKMARLAFNSMVDPDSGNALEDQMVAAVLVMLGEGGLALDYMERDAGKLGNNMDWAVMLPQMDPIRCEPRFIEMVSKLKTHDPRFAAFCKQVGLPITTEARTLP